jgi:hypothetical protein
MTEVEARKGIQSQLCNERGVINLISNQYVLSIMALEPMSEMRAA